MIGIIDYGAGNIRSVSNALKRLGIGHTVSSSIGELQRADKLILPGVGEARMAMDSLDRAGLIRWLKDVRVPFLGICLGMQLLFEKSDERHTDCLGILPGKIVQFDSRSLPHIKVPHMGWNQVRRRNDSPLFAGIAESEHFYFVHSYYAPAVPETVGATEYGLTFSSAVQMNNFYGVQFHPEKSGSAGLQLLKNFGERC
ncbi:MAG: imidazole glycerol phosphate synthase subunit HisH [Ignavibacteriae bacterium]|nr:imidazole glycerol phosphate synthase subunit HisH [Ignavibacteriota bacterium]